MNNIIVNLFLFLFFFSLLHNIQMKTNNYSNLTLLVYPNTKIQITKFILTQKKKKRKKQNIHSHYDFYVPNIV